MPLLPTSLLLTTSIHITTLFGPLMGFAYQTSLASPAGLSFDNVVWTVYGEGVSG